MTRTRVHASKERALRTCALLAIRSIVAAVIMGIFFFFGCNIFSSGYRFEDCGGALDKQHGLARGVEVAGVTSFLSKIMTTTLPCNMARFEHVK